MAHLTEGPRDGAASHLTFSPENRSYQEGACPAGREAGVYRRFAKRFLDVLAVLLAAPIVLPLVAALALLVRRDGGPAFYIQDRVGQGGRLFRCWKLRSMVPDADAELKAHLERDPAARREWAVHQKLKDDPRITPIGRIIRKTSMDELPQLWNVLCGDMSLVGPRPMMPEQSMLYPGEAYYRLRPGLTGFWQISARNGTAFADRAHYDSQYDSRLSFLTDTLVLIATVRVVLRGTGQ
jgi:exopolysaccharide production protein ExoY